MSETTLEQTLKQGLRVLRRQLKKYWLLKRIAFEVGFLKSQRRLRANISNPQTFNEKLEFKAAYDRRPILTTFADKIVVRDYVAHRVGAGYLTKAHAVIYDLNKFDWTSLPEEFAFKANHASAANLIVFKGANADEKLTDSPQRNPWKTHIVRPENFSLDWLRKRAQVWQRLNYSWKPGSSGIVEWPYKNIKPGFLVEELLLEADGMLARDFKLHVFNGVCRYINVIHRNYKDSSTAESKTYSNVMTPSWEPINLVLNQNPPLPTPAEPPNLREMIEIAEQLANGIDYVRVDLYNIAGRVLFGELTNLPSAAVNTFEPADFDLKWGNLLKLDNYGKSKNFES